MYLCTHAKVIIPFEIAKFIHIFLPNLIVTHDSLIILNIAIRHPMTIQMYVYRRLRLYRP